MTQAIVNLENKLFSSRCSDFPEPFSLKKYDQVRLCLIEEFKKFDDIIGFYEFGEVTAPGISDLDIAVVLKTEPRNKNIGQEIANIAYSSTTKDILYGSTLMVFSEKHFPLITLWDDIEVNCLYGKDIKLRSFCRDISSLLTICQIMDWLPERILALMRLLHEETVSIKNLIGYLYSLHYTFCKIMQLGITDAGDLNEYIASIKDLRIEWFMKSETENKIRLGRLWGDALRIGVKYLSSVAIWLVSEHFYTLPENLDNLGELSLTRKTGYSFQSRFQSDQLSLLAAPAVNEQMLLPIPGVWAFHLKTYASMDGAISIKLQRAFTNYPQISGTINMELLSILHKRMALCNEMAEFLYRYNFSKGLFKFGWFY